VPPATTTSARVPAAAALAQCFAAAPVPEAAPATATPPAETASDRVRSDYRVATIGNVDSGKSTLIGVLSGASLDDGRGAARRTVLKHDHELETGRTSAVSVEVVGFDAAGERVVPTGRNQAQRWASLADRTATALTLIDLCGHEKYLKTTLFGLTGLAPDLALLVVGANMGVQVMTREHIAIVCALRLPLAVVLTKVCGVSLRHKPQPQRAH